MPEPDWVDPTARARIQAALDLAPYGRYDGDHHKNWVIDQMVRALTGCPVIEKTAVDTAGQSYMYQDQGENHEYRQFVATQPWWDEGVAP